jgi:molecular chaperone HscC
MLIGIDLGTTNSLVGVFRNGEAELIPNALGHLLTPSAVSFADDGSVLVGLPALERASMHLDATATAFKRWMGTDHRVAVGGRQLRAEELSALVLKSLKADAEAYLGEPVTEAVITVPAYFNDVQRQATRTAGQLAGLKVERLLNEPTAAGLAYKLQDRRDHTSFLVFDLGGGTFDVSVLDYFEGVVEVRASAGDTRLGGEDFVQVLVDAFLEKTAGLTPAEREALAHDKTLWRAAEQAKRDLSERDSAAIDIQRDGQNHRVEVTRAGFEERCAPLLQRMRQPMERALRDAQVDPDSLDEVVMVGGASRMPVLRQMVTRMFSRLPLRTINPDEAIARGAVIQAGLKARDAALEEVVLTDVMPYSLGVVVSEEVGDRRYADRFSPIIERNTPVPVSRVQAYSTVQDNQAVIKLDIRQGESPIGSENIQLGELDVPVPRLPRGEVSVNVRFTYDANGLLEVEAQVPLTGQKYQNIIQRNAAVMDERQIRLALEKLQKLKIHPRDKQENTYLLSRARRLYEEHLGEGRKDIGHMLMRFEAALDSQDEHLIRQARAQFKDYLDSIDKGFVL